MQEYGRFCTVPACDDENGQIDCDGGYLELILEYPLCFQWHTFGRFDGTEWHHYSWLESCLNSGYCQMTSRICRDYSSGLIIKCPEYETTYEMINLNCQTTEIPPPPFDPPFEGERVTSECFKKYTCP